MSAPAGSQQTDLLSTLLQPIRLTGVFSSRWSLTEPWSIEGDAEPHCAVLHYVAEGSCWISADGIEPTLLTAGDLAVFPTGTAHRFADRPDRPGVALRTLLADRLPGTTDSIEFGGDGSRSRILCAGLHHDAGGSSPLYHALPRMTVLRRAQLEAEPLLRAAVDTLDARRDLGAGDGPGAAAVTLRVFEMVFVLALRPLLTAMTERPEMLAALANPAVSRALTAMHTRYAEPWTLRSLAAEANLSRSTFAGLFRELVGEGPATHLTACRMRAAARLLVDTDVPQSAVPGRVGYQSAVGFHRAFRRHFGTTPGEYRLRSRVAAGTAARTIGH
ncbi:AraC-like DNA-binding protein [Actinoalloteichus hoggarensis]|uniref:Exoenzyme S synthesis regulatory protein ExsA n=1 Tax=Actinoalloteichus hoggarensis TaxID=1470176 RepID=A0A221W7S8_9PSEU|nr:AraC family transcriptional regulator [Actinoalloteichus hoggarensis]ASO21763.1 Exoenzyme S synthesis regulatory protein ExsA [Actinoalloteichus hoggarensis]MBB5922360.1 AraC-like DNA-binding protein [Actinoalloteichus hoggarensis]